MKALRLAKSPYTSLIFNFTYAVGNCVFGFFVYSWWFITLGTYYAVLAAARFSVLKIGRRTNGSAAIEASTERITGILLVALSVCLIGVNILSAVKDRGKVFHEIVMITVAVYSFTKITAAIVGVVRAKHASSPIVKTLRNISLADALVSLYSMQRSMLVSFPGMDPAKIQLLNIFTGSSVWVIVLLLGLNLLGGKGINMAKSKIVKANEKIAEAVTDGYKKIEKGVVDGYKKIEQGVVHGYTKIEDKFVEAYLAKDGESVEDAKARLKKENK